MLFLKALYMKIRKEIKNSKENKKKNDKQD
jgi:hypothetical protein